MRAEERDIIKRFIIELIRTPPPLPPPNSILPSLTFVIFDFPAFGAFSLTPFLVLRKREKGNFPIALGALNNGSDKLDKKSRDFE